MFRKIVHSFLVLLMLIVLLAVPRREVLADTPVTTSDMISMMNNLRTGTYGFPALVENASLDSCAQWTATTMASINAYTHLVYLGYDGATARCATFGFGGGKTIVVTENFAYDQAMTMTKLANYWNDAAHMLPASDPQYLYVGAAVASASNGTVYYVLQAGAISGETVASTPYSSGTQSSGDTVASPTSGTSQYMSPVITSTPNYDGNIYHTVQYGQTLFDIALAYNITLAYLKSENGLTSDNVQAGTTLLIKPAPTSTVTPTPTSTLVYPTRTPTFTPQPKTPTPVLTATPTPVPSLMESLPKFDRGSFGILLVILSGLGLAALIFFNFGKSKKLSEVPAPPVNNVKKPEIVEEKPELEINRKVPRKKK